MALVTWGNRRNQKPICRGRRPRRPAWIVGADRFCFINSIPRVLNIQDVVSSEWITF